MRERRWDTVMTSGFSHGGLERGGLSCSRHQGGAESDNRCELFHSRMYASRMRQLYASCIHASGQAAFGRFLGVYVMGAQANFSFA